MICSMPGCGGVVMAKRMCGRCYRRRPLVDGDKICSTPGCGRAHCAKSLCDRCYPRHPDVRAKNFACQGRRNGFLPALTAALLTKQDGRCAICAVGIFVGDRGPRGINRDHDHVTGRARGLLCSMCNMCLGIYEKRQRPAGLVIEVYESYLRSPPADTIRTQEPAEAAPPSEMR